jgi:2-methylisocitrate lyase-like PEP mutase family enzyme
LRTIEDQAARLAAARAAADDIGVPMFINARTDIFLNAPANEHSESLVNDAIARARAYASAGASGFFIPGLVNETFIARICRESPLPVNVMMMPGAPSPQRLRELGVARISHGPGPFRAMQKWLAGAAKEAMEAVR